MWVSVFFFFKQKTEYEIRLSLVGSEVCIRDGCVCVCVCVCVCACVCVCVCVCVPVAILVKLRIACIGLLPPRLPPSSSSPWTPPHCWPTHMAVRYGLYRLTEAVTTKGLVRPRAR